LYWTRLAIAADAEEYKKKSSSRHDGDYSRRQRYNPVASLFISPPSRRGGRADLINVTLP
jgi:hypothetical protein